jgi:hypothetical protein
VAAGSLRLRVFITGASAGLGCALAIPWQMALVARVLNVPPAGLYDRLFAHAPRKPRRQA